MLPQTQNPKVYYISFSYFNTTTNSYDTVDKQLFPYDPNTGTSPGTVGYRWEPIRLLNGTQVAVLPGSVRVYRQFDRVTTAGNTINWGDASDPYQYALLSNNIAPFANIGRIAFHPSGAGYGQRNASGQQAFTAYIDYSVLDWHILREDREVPSGIPGQFNEVSVRTTLGNWKREGDPNADNTIYEGMFGAGASIDDDDVMVIDLQTGVPLTRGDYSAASATSDVGYWINTEQNGSYRSGTVFINTRVVPRGSQIRILYKAEGDWAVAVQKAYSRYQGVGTVYPAPDSPSSFTLSPPANPSARMLFNKSEYNKSFVAQFRYVMDDGTPDGRIVQTQSQQVTLEGTDGAPFVTQGTVDFSYADVSSLMPDRKPGTAWSVANNTAYGVSVKTRVIYRDTNSGRGANDADPSSGWRVQDVDTYLTRAF
jgi:hypothetical protein